MKILGISSKGYADKKYIAEISENEIANFLDFYSNYDMGKREIKIEVGDEVEVSALYRDAKKLAELMEDFRKFELFFKAAADFYIVAKASISAGDDHKKTKVQGEQNR